MDQQRQRDGQTAFGRHLYRLRAGRIFSIIDNQFRQFIIGEAGVAVIVNEVFAPTLSPDLLPSFRSSP